MPFESSRVDLVIQYVLLLAGEEEEPFHRRLGPIHLIKYVYLADLACARKLGGETFTGATWRFHNFGPWDPAVYERVELATLAIRAERIKFSSNYGDEDWVRYYLRDTERLSEIEKQVPSAIRLTLPNVVHKFLADTPSLLDYVYKTQPMLSAAPHEQLDLSIAAEPRPVQLSPDKEPTKSEIEIAEGSSSDLVGQFRMERLSTRKKKRFHEQIRLLHETRVAQPKLINPVKAPRYDEVYEHGIAWLEEMAGSPQFELGEFTAEFSDEVWKSSTRKGGDVS
jgi:hypothetical protein